MGPGHKFFIVYHSKHLQFFHHKSSHLLAKCDVSKLLKAIPFPSLNVAMHCIIWTIKLLQIVCRGLRIGTIGRVL